MVERGVSFYRLVGSPDPCLGKTNSSHASFIKKTYHSGNWGVKILNMKKLLLIVTIVTMVCSAKAQEITWGIRAGLNVPKVNEKIKGDDGEWSSDYKSKVGFHLGVIADLGLSESFYIQPGLYFTTKGAKADYEGMTEKLNLSYLQLPILASYRFNLGGDTKLHINVGPYFALGVGGKFKYEEDGETYKIDAFGTSDEDSDEEKGGLKRFDAGLAFGAGVSFGKIYAGLNYDLGLANIANKDEWGSDYKLKNRSFNISVGYNF